jgi:uncharacterized protein (DUF305 family)
VASKILEVLRRRSFYIPAVAVVLALAVGYTVGYATPSLRAPGNDSAEAGFARDMSVHHNQAVQMGMLAFAKSPTLNIRNLGYDIALTQNGQVGVMGQWLKEWGLLPTGDQPPMAWMPNGTAELKDGRMPGMATPEQLDALQKATGKPFDVLFCQLMLNHHLGGIHMVEGILAKTDNSDVRELATFMKRNQQAEVELLRQFLTSLGAQPLPS